MDWGLITVIIALVFLVGHIALDVRTLLKNVRGLHSNSPMHQAVCDKCHAEVRGRRELRHEALWTAGAIVVLIIHIIMDFTL